MSVTSGTVPVVYAVIRRAGWYMENAEQRLTDDELLYVFDATLAEYIRRAKDKPNAARSSACPG